MPKGINGLALGITLGGAAFLYSGISGSGLSQTIRGFIAGDLPGIQGFNTTTTAAGTTTTDGTGVVALAQAQLGKKYVWDMPKSWHVANPPSFDCSGLTGWCYYNAAKITLPHSAAAQEAMLKKRPLSNAQPGDLVFYKQGIRVYHVAIYIGSGNVIEAPEQGIPVRTRAIKAGDTDLMNTVGVFPGGKAAATGAASGGGNPAANKQLAQMLAATYGWTGSEWTALDNLWTRESGFSNTATGAETSQGRAYGIAQALPDTKYPEKGQASGGSDPATQIRWGLKYIKSRYGSPSAAWAHELANSWY